MVFGLWSLIFDLWSLVFGLWSLVFDLWSLVFGLWSLVFGLWSLIFEVCCGRSVLVATPCGFWLCSDSLTFVVHDDFPRDADAKGGKRIYHDPLAALTDI